MTFLIDRVRDGIETWIVWTPLLDTNDECFARVLGFFGTCMVVVGEYCCGCFCFFPPYLISLA